MTRYIVGFLLAVGLIIIVIVLIIKALTGGPKNQAPSVQDITSFANTSTTVQFTIDSPVTASQNHKDIIINVGNAQADLRVTQGYEGQTIREKSYPMNANAYTVFLKALDYNGFTKGNNDASLQDERGHCATGDRYIYEAIDPDGNTLQHYWYTSCNNGTFQGNVSVIQQLFENQIPDYGSLTGDVSL